MSLAWSRNGFQTKLVVRAIQEGATSFNAIAKQSGGMYPGDLSKMLSDLVEAGVLRIRNDRYVLGELLKPGTPGESADLGTHVGGPTAPIQLPEPHPHDCDWRFTKSTTNAIADRVRRIAGLDGRVVLIGAPSVWAVLAQDSGQANATLIDASAELILYLTRHKLPVNVDVIRCDVLAEADRDLGLSAEVVLCDPPWYPEHYDAFLVAASRCLVIGGTLLLSLLPVGTRPVAVKDRWAVLRAAQDLGMSLQEIRPGLLAYETPAFEVNSLRLTGMSTIGRWRYGDLAVFRQVTVASPSVRRKGIRRAWKSMNHSEQWHELIMGRNKVKLRGPFDDLDVPPEIRSIEENDVLPSVSRRYPGRSRIDLWLWDNRVYAVRGRAAIWCALNSIIGRQAVPEPAVPEIYRRQAVEVLYNQIGELAKGI